MRPVLATLYNRTTITLSIITVSITIFHFFPLSPAFPVEITTNIINKPSWNELTDEDIKNYLISNRDRLTHQSFQDPTIKATVQRIFQDQPLVTDLLLGDFATIKELSTESSLASLFSPETSAIKYFNTTYLLGLLINAGVAIGLIITALLDHIDEHNEGITLGTRPDSSTNLHIQRLSDLLTQAEQIKKSLQETRVEEQAHTIVLSQQPTTQLPSLHETSLTKKRDVDELLEIYSLPL